MRRALVLLFLAILLVALVAHFLAQEQAAEFLGDIAFFALIGAVVVDTCALAVRIVAKWVALKSKSASIAFRKVAFLRRSLKGDRSQ